MDTTMNSEATNADTGSNNVKTEAKETTGDKNNNLIINYLPQDMTSDKVWF